MQHLGFGIVDSLRSQLDNIPYTDCVKATTCVLENLIDFISDSKSSIDIAALRQLQQEVESSQRSMGKKEMKDSFDYRTSTQLVEQLADFRHGHDNFERMWPSGEYSYRDVEGTDGSIADVLRRLRMKFNFVNPRILYEIIEYPGEGQPDEFKIITVLADELLWLLQNNEYSHTASYLTSFGDICDIFLHSISLHTHALEVISSNEVTRSCLFRICKKVLAFGTSDGTDNLEYWALVGKWMKLTTYVVSHLTKDPGFRTEFPDEHRKDEVFPDSQAFCSEFVPKLRCLKNETHTRLKEQFVALIVAFSFLFSDLTDGDGGIGMLNVLNEYLGSAQGDDEFLELMTYVVIGWWNHHGVGSILDGSNISEDFGLQNSVKLVSRYLISLTGVKILPVDTGVKFFCSSDTDLKEWEDGYYLMRDSEITVMKEVCLRMLSDCQPDEPVYQEACLMEQHIAQNARC